MSSLYAAEVQEHERSGAQGNNCNRDDKNEANGHGRSRARRVSEAKTEEGTRTVIKESARGAGPNKTVRKVDP